MERMKNLVNCRKRRQVRAAPDGMFGVKDEEDRELMLNEVALMRICSSGPNGFCLHVEDAWDDPRKILWIFVELMDGALTGIIKAMRNRPDLYTENALRWVMR